MTASRDYPPAPVPEQPTLPGVRERLDACRACELWENATRAVAGTGPPDARIVLVGEQPEDREDDRGQAVRGSRRARARAGHRPRPSALLRARDEREREAAIEMLVADRSWVASELRS